MDNSAQITRRSSPRRLLEDQEPANSSNMSSNIGSQTNSTRHSDSHGNHQSGQPGSNTPSSSSFRNPLHSLLASVASPTPREESKYTELLEEGSGEQQGLQEVASSTARFHQNEALSHKHSDGDGPGSILSEQGSEDKSNLQRSNSQNSTKKQMMNKLQLFATPLAAAFVASIAYVDPGNFATNIQAGSEFGYTLLWVVLLANIMAMLFQYLSAKLGIASGMNLARCCRESFNPRLNFCLWIIAELAAIATDIAEFVGAAVGLKILFGIPLIVGGIITAFTTFLLLYIHDKGARLFECIVIGFISIIAIAYVIETIIDKPDWGKVAYHLFVPGVENADAVLLAVGIVGATVMPHAIYLHSAIVQNRDGLPPIPVSKSFKLELAGIAIALGTAGFVNLAVLILSASSFHRNGMTEIATLEEAYVSLTPILGQAASYLFGIGLVASGVSSSAIGTLAGQVIMEGFLKYKIKLWVRRLITVVPSLIIILSGVDPTRSLVISQVVLSFCIPFALVPLVMFTHRSGLVGEWKNHLATTIFASIFSAIIIGMNFFLIISTIIGL